MPSEMFERGKRDAEADALDENYYHYYYDYKLAYDNVARNRRRSRRQLLARRVGRVLARTLPVMLLLAGAGFAAFRYLEPPAEPVAVAPPTPTRTRPTLVPPTPRPAATPTSELALRADSFAVITGTNGAPLLARIEPGTDKAMVIRIREGQTVRILEGPREASGYTWWRVELDGKLGWSAATFLQPVAPPP